MFYGVGVILGAGIYSVLGAAAAHAGAALWQAFALAAIVALLTALSYAELATMLPKAGGEYAYLREAFPGARWLGATVGLLVAVASAATAATVSIAFAGYLGERLPAPLVALGVVAVATGVNAIGVKASSGVNVVFTLLEVVGLALCVGVAATTTGLAPAIEPPGAGVITATSLVFFAFLGFETVVTLAEDSREPERHLPLAILASLAVATLLYVLVAMSAVALLDPQALAASDAPLTDAVAQEAPGVARIVGGLALFSTANTALVNVLAGSRILFAMGREGDVPRPLGRAPRGSPVLAVVATGAIAAALLPLGEVEVVASVASLLSLVVFGSVHVAVVVLRRREPDRRRPFRVPGGLALPALGLVVIAALATRFEPLVYGVAAAVLAAAAVVGVVARR